MRGTVDKFFPTKGYGFIKDANGESFFVHYTDIESKAQFRKLEDGQEVEFEVQPTDKGEKAVKVKILE